MDSTKDADTELKTLLRQAADEYERETGHGVDTSKYESVSSPGDVLAILERKGKDFNDFRRKHAKLWSVVRTVLTPISALGGIAADTTSAAPCGFAASAALGAAVYLIEAGNAVTEAYDWVQSVFRELVEFSERLAIYLQKPPLDNVLASKVIAILTFMFRLFGRSETLIKRKRFREYLKVAFLGRDDTTKSLLEDLNAHLKGEQAFTLALTYSSARGAEEAANRTEDITLRIEKSLANKFDKDSLKEQQNKDSAREEREIKIVEEVLKSPSFSDVESIFYRLKSELVEGSALWLQGEPLFQEWINHQAPVLWIFGPPGTGKSFLSARTIDYLMRMYNQKPGSWSSTSVAYFFVKEDRSSLTEANTMLKTLAWQLCQTDKQFRRYAAEVCKVSGNIATEDQTWRNLFEGYYRSPRSSFSRAILIIDGLDEAPLAVRKKMLNIINSTVIFDSQTIANGLNFAVFGRTSLRGDFFFTRREKLIELSREKNEEDISRYIDEKFKGVELLKVLRRGPDGKKKEAKQRKKMKQKILQGANGAFLWAHLFIKELEHASLVKADKVLKEPLRSLDDTIAQVFGRIEKDLCLERNQALKMLTWLTYARRPLQFAELKFYVSLPECVEEPTLWRALRGQFSSILELRFPSDCDPDSRIDSETDEEDSEDCGVSEEDDKDAVSSSASSSDEQDDEKSNVDRSSSVHVSPKPNALSGITESRGRRLTVVMFYHQRIRDYLRLEGFENVDNNRGHLPLAIDNSRAQIMLSIDCLLIFSLPGIQERVDMLKYPAKHFIAHLENIDERTLTSEGRIGITLALINLFREPQHAMCLLLAAQSGTFSRGRDLFWSTWIRESGSRKIVRNWFQKALEDTSVCYVGADRMFMQEAIKSVVAFLKGIATAASQIWLMKKGHDDPQYLESFGWLTDVIRCYLKMDDEGSIPEEYQAWSWSRGRIMPAPTYKELLQAAEWAGIKQTTHFHSCFGWILWQFNFLDEAIQEMDKAIELDGGAWMAIEGRALALRKKNKHNEAIQCMEDAIKQMPETVDFISASLYGHLSKWHLALGDNDKAFEMARIAFEKNPGGGSATAVYLDALGRRLGYEQKIIEALDMITQYQSQDGQPRLVIFFAYHFCEVWDIIGPACRRNGWPTFPLMNLDKSLVLMEKSGNSKRFLDSKRKAGLFRIQYYDQKEEGIKLLEEALAYLERDKILDGLNAERAFWRAYISNDLAQVTFDLAVEAYHNGQDTTMLVTRLKQLSIASGTTAQESDKTDVFDTYGYGYPVLLWGRWLRDYGKVSKSVWGKSFRARLLEQMACLDDDDPSNDKDAILALFPSLFQAGDEANAGAILAMLLYPIELEQKVEEAASEIRKTASFNSEVNTINASTNGKSQEVKKQVINGDPEPVLELIYYNESLPLNVLNEHILYFCDVCDKELCKTSEFHFCKICNDIQFCENCIVRLKADKLVKKICNPAHSFYQAWPVPEDARQRAAIWSEEGTARLSVQWLQQLRAEWL